MRWILIGFFVLTSLAQARSFETTVTPLPNQTFAGPCLYDLTLPAGGHSVRAVWVTFDRGRDIMFYSDPDVVAFARRHDLALMMPHQCPAKTAPGGPKEMDMDPSHGIGRALFTALDQFAQQSGPPELSSAKLILLGFSGTGALFAHFVGYAPDRVVASIPTDPGYYDPVGVDNVHLPPAFESARATLCKQLRQPELQSEAHCRSSCSAARHLGGPFQRYRASLC